MLAAGASLLGYGAVTQALAQTGRRAGVEWAHMLAPGDGRITALLSEKRSGPEANAAQRKEADRLARDALRQDATAVAAVATLGINAQIRGETALARRFFAYSDRLSRRDLRTRLWAIEDAVVRDDFTDALKHYDIALRTSRVAAELLLPILTTAVEDAPIRKALTETLTGKPTWSQRFLDYAAANASDPRPVAILFRDLRRSGVPVSATDDSLLITALVAKRAFDQAWDYYALTQPGVDRRRSRDRNFKTGIERPSPFDWVPIGDSGISASIQAGDEGGVFDFAVSPGLGGVLLRQIQLLPPGRYVLRGTSANIEQPEGSRPYWQLTCESGKELGQVPVPNSSQSDGAFAGQFVVPADCAVQILSLMASSTDRLAGVTGQITQAQLQQVR